MIAITKGVLALSALASAGVVTAYDWTAPAADRDSAAYQVSYRFPQAEENFTLVVPMKTPAREPQKQNADGRKGDRIDSCGQREWPYIAQSCLVSANGSPMRKISRVVTIERRIAEDASEFIRVQSASFAPR